MSDTWGEEVPELTPAMMLDRARRITSRELARCTSAVLDGLRTSGQPVLIFRYGVPVAVLTRFDERAVPGAVEDPRRGDPPMLGDDASGVAHDTPTLDDDERTLLATLVAGPPHGVLLDNVSVPIPRAIAALMDLEMKGFATRMGGRWLATDRGSAIAASVLRSDPRSATAP